MEKTEITYRDILESSLCSSKVFYEIEGKKLLYKFKDSRYYFFSGKFFDKIELSIDYNFFFKTISAILSCIPIDTLNPRDVWFKIILNESENLIQIIEAGSTSRNLQTEKSLKKYLDNFGVVDYGDVKTFIAAGYFNKYQNIENFLREENLDDAISLKGKEQNFYSEIKSVYFAPDNDFHDFVIDVIRKVKIDTSKGEFSLFKGF